MDRQECSMVFSPSAMFLFHCSYRRRHGARKKPRAFPPLPQSQARFSYTLPNPSLACLLVCMPEGTVQRLCFTVFTPTARVHAEKRMGQGEVVRRETSWRCLVAYSLASRGSFRPPRRLIIAAAPHTKGSHATRRLPFRRISIPRVPLPVSSATCAALGSRNEDKLRTSNVATQKVDNEKEAAFAATRKWPSSWRGMHGRGRVDSSVAFCTRVKKNLYFLYVGI